MLPSVNINLNISSDSLGIAKLIDTLAEGVGALYAPIHIRRKGKAEAERIQYMAEVSRNNLDIPFRYEQDGLTVSTDKEFAELAQRTILRNLAREMNKQLNIENVVSCARDILEHEQEVSKEPVSQTWLSNFFEAVGYVEEEDLQKIWGKLLAGEIKQPKSYSLRTLNTLKNMTSNEAKIFQSLSSFIIMSEGKGFLLNDNKLHEKYDIEYENILLLDDCGLINSQGETNCVFPFKPKSIEQLYNNNCLAELHKKIDIDTNVQFDAYPLTSAGIELFNIVSKDSNSKFFKDVIKQIEHNNKNISALIYKKELITGKDGKMIEHFDFQHPIYPEK